MTLATIVRILSIVYYPIALRKYYPSASNNLNSTKTTYFLVLLAILIREISIILGIGSISL